MFTEIGAETNLRTRDDDYNYLNQASIKKYLEKYPIKKLVSNWNFLGIELKSTSDPLEFKTLFKENKINSYNSEPDCIGKCFACHN